MKYLLILLLLHPQINVFLSQFVKPKNKTLFGHCHFHMLLEKLQVIQLDIFSKYSVCIHMDTRQLKIIYWDGNIWSAMYRLSLIDIFFAIDILQLGVAQSVVTRCFVYHLNTALGLVSL